MDKQCRRGILQYFHVSAMALTVLLTGCLGGGKGGGDTTPPPGRPDWAHIKAHARPQVVLANEFQDAVLLKPPSSPAWEDGVFISRDGLHLYAFYSPADVYQYSVNTAGGTSTCVDITPYLRGSLLGMDLQTNPWGCDRVLHSDIAHATRGTTSQAFGTWQLSGMSAPVTWEGGFQALENGDGTIDAVLSRSTDKRKNDLYWARGVSHNPPLSAFTPMPDPVNSTAQEDNPHLERLDNNTLVLLFDNHGQNDPTTTIKYTMSHDNGARWSPPAELGTNINTGPHDLTGHLYFDGNNWWLYFASERDGALAIYRSLHQSGDLINDFDHWGSAQIVIAPGTVDDGSGFMSGVGEPSLTSRGDLVFAAVYGASNPTDHDASDIDVWMAARR
ncbi:MAG TPA: exo-alpha-sialidase [Gammaproteobacteria bacterium]|nr:exo-alpha-sialidase [Gammaproteobacteria bacterium]